MNSFSEDGNPKFSFPLCKQMYFLRKISTKENMLLDEWGWSDGVMVLGKLPVPGHPTNFSYSRARACYACSRWELFGRFFSCLSSFSFVSLSLGDGPI